MTIHRPDSVEALCDIMRDATDRGARLALRGGGSKDAIGRSVSAETIDMTGFAGVIDYDPPELVLTVGAGTPLDEIRTLVAARGQMLAFEPFDHGPILGGPAGKATIGGIVAAGVSGSSRLTMGGARDHLLGFEAVSGRGERFVAGGRVVKNVTGYDLSKLITGSWGRLAALTHVTLKVLPAPQTTQTCLIEGLSLAEAYQAMARALGSRADIAAAAHLPAEAGGRSATLLRVQGFTPSVTARAAMLSALLGRMEILDVDTAAPLWERLATLSPFATAQEPLWRISIPPRACAETAAHLGSRVIADWAGGLLWASTDLPADRVREIAAMAGGHAMLVRASPALRATVPAFHPRPAPVAALEARVRRAFDPAGIFETGRFDAG